MHRIAVEPRRRALHADDRGELTLAPPDRRRHRVQVVLALPEVVGVATFPDRFELRGELGSLRDRLIRERLERARRQRTATEGEEHFSRRRRVRDAWPAELRNSLHGER